MSGQALRLVLGFLVGAWLTRSLGVDATGVLGTILTIGSMLGFVAEFGLRQILIKEISAAPERSAIVFGSGVRMLAFSGIAAYVLGSTITALVGGWAAWVTVLIAFSPLLFLPHVAFLARWDAMHQARRGAQFGLLALLGTNLAKIITIVYHGGVKGAATAIALESIFVALGAFFLGTRLGWLRDCARFDSKAAKLLLAQAFPHFLAHSGTLLLLRIDQLMILPMRGKTEAGLYAAATRLSELVYMIGPAIVLTFLPRLTALHREDPAAYRRQCGILFSIMSCIGYAVIACWWIAGAWVVKLLYGEAFAGCTPVLSVHCVAALASLHGSLLAAFLVVEGRAKLGAIATYSGVVVNVLLNLWWIPRYGALGAAWATAITYYAVWFGGPMLLQPIRWLALEQLRSLLAPLTLPFNWRESLRLRRS